MDDMVSIPYSMARSLMSTDHLTGFTVKVDKSDNVDTVIRRLETVLDETIDSSVGTYRLEDGNSAMSESTEETTSMSVVLGGIAGIALLVGGIGIMNIMLVSVTERTREIGIRRAIGAERSSIVIQFLIEAAMLCGIGGIIGILIGTGGSLLVGRLMFQMTIYPAAWITLCAFTLSVALGILFGIYPAAKAARLQPVEALRAE